MGPIICNVFAFKQRKRVSKFTQSTQISSSVAIHIYSYRHRIRQEVGARVGVSKLKIKEHNCPSIGLLIRDVL